LKLPLGYKDFGGRVCPTINGGNIVVGDGHAFASNYAEAMVDKKASADRQVLMFSIRLLLSPSNFLINSI